MKTLIISDLHLRKAFDQNYFDILRQLFGQYENIILNGDFWDSYYLSFDEFLNSEWNQLFPILKSKNTIYLEGNHDFLYQMDDRVHEFCNEMKVKHKINWKDKTLVITHGHTFKKSKIQKYKFLKNSKYVFELLKFGNLILEKTPFDKILNNSSAKSLKKEVLKSKKSSEIFIIGHSHIPELDLENGYVNCGFFKKDRSFVVVDEDEIRLEEI